MNKINSSYCLNLLMAIISNRTIEFKFYILLKKEKKEFKFYILKAKFKNIKTIEQEKKADILLTYWLKLLYRPKFREAHCNLS